MRRIGIAAGLLALGISAGAQVKVEKVKYFGRPNCYRLSNGTVEAIVTTDIGPRIIRYGFKGGKNVLAEIPDAVVKTKLGNWKPWGGHRLWIAPEHMPNSYFPDNSPIRHEPVGNNGIKLIGPVETPTGLRKEMTVTLDSTGAGLTVKHRLINEGQNPASVAPWALTIMATGGTTIIPQEPFKRHEDALLPARPMVLWHYTDLTDPRWQIGPKFLRLSTNARIKTPQKIGVGNKQGWAAYAVGGNLFVKRFPYRSGVTYPDMGCNTETYTEAAFMELETVGHMHRLSPGEAAEHTERWHLFRGFTVPRDDNALQKRIAPLIARTSAVR